MDLVAGYGGDGTQHEIANALMTAARDGGREMVMGVLPAGTGNGFARELGVPGKRREAVEVRCTSRATRAIDAGRLLEVAANEARDRYFIQRVYVGIEPEEQTSRELAMRRTRHLAATRSPLGERRGLGGVRCPRMPTAYGWTS